MGSKGSNVTQDKPVEAETRRIIPETEVEAHPLYQALGRRDVRKYYSSDLVRGILRNPESGHIEHENYDMTGREFNSQFQAMKKELENLGYQVTVTTSDRKEGGEYRLKRGYGFKRTAVTHHTRKKLEWKKV